MTESHDFECALGDLLALFTRALRNGVPPHQLDPIAFHQAWTVLNAQPFEVRRFWHQSLLAIYRPGRAASPIPTRTGKRYAYAHAA